MAPLLEDPRIRQTWNQISQNAGEATESAAAGIWTFGHKYITPCFASVAESINSCTAPCFPDREERARRLRERGRTRGRAELSFDFYDDWDEDDGLGNRGLLGGWGNDELDRLLAGSGSHSGGGEGIDQAPKRKRGMSYGTRGRRKSLDPDPTVIPSTSALGFLGRLPFKLGGTLRYKPSAADLQDHPGTMRNAEFAEEEEGEPLISDEHSDDEERHPKTHNRTRSSTTSSGATSDSFRSRGDLFPSDGEDDAVPLPDEFAMVLERRTTIPADDKSSAKTKSSKGKRPATSRKSSRALSRTTVSSQSRPSLTGQRVTSGVSLTSTPDIVTPNIDEPPSLSELQLEEERIRHEEETEVEMKREAAVKLALERGLHAGEPSEVTISEPKVIEPAVENIPPPKPLENEDIENGDNSTYTEAPKAGLDTGNSDGSSESRDRSRSPSRIRESEERLEEVFVPARLPHFG